MKKLIGLLVESCPISQHCPSSHPSQNCVREKASPHWLLASYLKRTRNNSKTRLYLGLIDCNWNLCYSLRMISLQGPLAFQQAENHTEWCAHLRWISLPEAGAILVTWWNASPPLGVVSKSLEPQNAQTKGPWFKKIQHHFDIDAHRLARPCVGSPVNEKKHKENNP